MIGIIRNFGVLPGEALTIWKGFLRNSNDFFASTTRLSLFLFLHYLKVNFAKFYRETGYKDLKLLRQFLYFGLGSIDSFLNTSFVFVFLF